MADCCSMAEAERYMGKNRKRENKGKWGLHLKPFQAM